MLIYRTRPMSQKAHLTLEGIFFSNNFFCFPPMTDLNLLWVKLHLPLLPFPTLHHAIYFVLRRRLNMHELSGVLRLDGLL